MTYYDRTYQKAARTRKPAAKKTTLKRTYCQEANKPRACNPLMFEILDLASRQRTKAKKVEVLPKYECMTLKSLFIWNFDETITTQLPGEVLR